MPRRHGLFATNRNKLTPTKSAPEPRTQATHSRLCEYYPPNDPESLPLSYINSAPVCLDWQTAQTQQRQPNRLRRTPSFEGHTADKHGARKRKSGPMTRRKQDFASPTRIQSRYAYKEQRGHRSPSDSPAPAGREPMTYQHQHIPDEARTQSVRPDSYLAKQSSTQKRVKPARKKVVSFTVEPVEMKSPSRQPSPPVLASSIQNKSQHTNISQVSNNQEFIHEPEYDSDDIEVLTPGQPEINKVSFKAFVKAVLKKQKKGKEPPYGGKIGDIAQDMMNKVEQKSKARKKHSHY